MSACSIDAACIGILLGGFTALLSYRFSSVGVAAESRKIDGGVVRTFLQRPVFTLETYFRL